MQLPWHPSWISCDSEKICFPFLHKIVLMICERYHQNGCRNHIEHPLNGKTMYPLVMSDCIAKVAGDHIGLYAFINTPILINVNSLVMHQCCLEDGFFVENKKKTYLFIYENCFGVLKLCFSFFQCSYDFFIYSMYLLTPKHVGIDTKIYILCQILGKLLSFYKSPK